MDLQLEEMRDRLLGGDRLALARAISLVENMDARRGELLRLVAPFTGRAHVLGITGSPGAGKSTLVGAVVRVLRRSGSRVGVLAVDPTSPFTGGALLGDRIRLAGLEGDAGVFTRSMATRGERGGLSLAAAGAVRLMEAAGFETVIVETVGVGQAEWEVRDLADTVLVVLTPGTGDSIQALKAGIMEIADVFAVNKADLPGANEVWAAVTAVLDMRRDCNWKPPVLPVTALDGGGVEELVDHLLRHRQYLQESGLWAEKRVRRWEAELRAEILHRLLAQCAELQGTPAWQEALAAVSSGVQDVAQAAAKLLQGAQADGADP